MSLLEKDCYKNLTAKDFIESGLMVGIDKDSLEELEYGQQLNKRINKMLKGWFIIQERERAKKNYQEVGDNGLITTDWFETEIEGIRIVGDRTVEARPGVEEDPKKEWFFRGICTYQEFEEFEKVYPTIKEELSEYEPYSWDLDLYIAGGIVMGRNFVGFDTEQEWRDKSVLISAT